MSAWFASLTPRERWLVGLLGPVAVAALLWTFVWQPVQADRERLTRTIADARTVAAALERYPEGAVAARPAPLFDAPLTTRVTRSAEAAGVPLARIEPRRGGLTALVSEAPYAAVLNWIAEMERVQGVRLAAIALDRRTAPGTVSVRLELEAAT